MMTLKNRISTAAVTTAMVWAAFSAFLTGSAFGASEQFQGRVYAMPNMKPVDSTTLLKPGDLAPDFELPSLAGETVRLSSFRGSKNVVISFVPAAWTPVCSEQWPGYNVLKELFESHDVIVLGITVDNLPTLYAWTEHMGGVWFPVLSDFWPHGEVSKRYGVLRTNGISERALFLVDKQGVIKYIDVHDINERPAVEVLVEEMKGFKK